MDDSDELAGTVPKDIVVSPAFSDLFIVVQFIKVALFLTTL